MHKPPAKKPCPTKCPQLPGTIIRINIPAGAVINLLNLIEITSPSGICLIIRLPIFDKEHKLDKEQGLRFFTNAIARAGGTVEYLQE
jgi:hypothetical protein